MAGRQILQNFKLFHERAFVNGKWLCGKRTFPVFNPANGEVRITQYHSVGFLYIYF